MAEFYLHKDSIEGRKIKVYSRKILKTSTLIMCKILGRCVKYKCDKNSSAQIEQELEKKDKDKLRNPLSNLNVDDKLKCDALFVLHSGIKYITPSHDEGATGTHGGQYIHTTTRSYAEITTPFKHIEDALLKRKNELGVSNKKSLVIEGK